MVCMHRYGSLLWLVRITVDICGLVWIKYGLYASEHLAAGLRS